MTASNNSEDSERLFTIFVLEDDPKLGKDLVDLFKRDFAHTAVEWSKYIEEGLGNLNSPQHYDVAVSDIRLPFREGDKEPKAYPDVAERLRELRIPTIFITAWKETEDVQSFLRKRTLADPTTVVIEKKGRFYEDLFRQIRSLFMLLARKRVTEDVERFLKGTSNGRSGTAMFVFLSKLVTAYWPYLDTATRSQLHKQFTITDLEDNGGLQLSIKE